jgi:predicted phosphodiesterase
VQWHNNDEVTEQVLQIVPELTPNYNNPIEVVVQGVHFSATKDEPLEIGDYTSRNIFRAQVTGLSPNTQYKYKVGSEGSWSQEFAHLTSRGTDVDFSFTVVADSQDASSDQTFMKNTLKAANDYDPDNRFFLHCGDVVEQIGNDPAQVVYYTNAANEINRSKPVITTQGNHDTYNVKSASDYNDRFNNAVAFNAHTVFPINGWEGNIDDQKKSQSYYFYYNKVLFIMLNTLIEDNQHASQAEWLRGVLRHDRDNNLSRYTIVCTHKGPFGNHYYEDYYIRVVRANYGKLFSDFNVDIVFHGHDHTYVRTNPIKIPTMAVNEYLTPANATFFDATPNGTIYSIPGSTGKKLYGERNESGTTPMWDTTYIRRTKTESEVSGGVFVNVKVRAGQLEVMAMRTNKQVDANLPDQYNVPRKMATF